MRMGAGAGGRRRPARTSPVSRVVAELEDLPRLVGGRAGAVPLPREARDAAHELGVLLREHALVEEDVVLEAEADVAAKGQRRHGHRHVPAADAGASPGRPFRDAVDQEQEVPRLAAHAARHAQDEVPVQQRAGRAVLLDQLESVVDLAGLEDLELRPHALLLHALVELAHQRRVVEEDVVAEVGRARRQRRHLRAQLQRLQPLVGGHAHGAAGARLDDDVRALADRLDRRREDFLRLRRVGRGVAHVQVVHRGAGLAAARRVGADLRRRHRQAGLRVLGGLGAHAGHGDDELVHRLPLLTPVLRLVRVLLVHERQALLDHLERPGQVTLGVAVADVPVVIRLHKEPAADALRVELRPPLLVLTVDVVEGQERHRRDAALGHRDAALVDDLAERREELRPALPDRVLHLLALEDLEALHAGGHLEAVGEVGGAQEGVLDVDAP